MSFAGRLGIVLGVLVAAVIAVGCGGTVIDTSKIEAALKQNVEESQDVKVASISCPSDQEVEPKATFECTMDLAGGGTRTATLEIDNEKADTHVVKEASGSNE